MTTFRLQGRIVNDVQTPQPGATVRLYSLLDPLGSDPRAAVLNPGAVTWTRRISGFQGSAWNAWQKFIARETAGITWPEFRADVGKYNQSLKESEDVFQAENTYVLPENKPLEFARNPLPAIVWDRSLMAFQGSVWDCWRQFVQLKVIGLNWEQFKTEFAKHNPHIKSTNGKLLIRGQYQLPRSADHDRYYRLEYADAKGRFQFDDLLPGEYGLEVMAEGYQPYRQSIVVDADADIVIELDPIPSVIERGTEDFVQVQGTEFVLNGKTFRFIGINLRGLVYYGDKGTLPFAEEADCMEQLGKASEMGVRVVRVFLPSENVETETVVARLEHVLSIMREHFSHMRLIISLTNLYSDNPFRVRHDTGSYEQPAKETNNYKLLLPSWFDQGYNVHYKPFVTSIVKHFCNEPLIMAWEPGNELKVDDDSELFVRFMLTMTRYIADLAPKQLVTTGITSTRVAYMQDKPDLQRKLYRDDSIDFITNHAYNGTNHEDDSGLAHILDKPFIIEEAGFDAGKAVPAEHKPVCVVDGEWRRDCVVADMNKWFEKGARGYMQWGFMIGFDNQDGDKWSGMDQIHHRDWDDLFNAYRERAAILSTQTEAVVMSVKPPPKPQQISVDFASFAVGMTVQTTTAVNVRREPGHINKVAGDIQGMTRPGTAVELLAPPEQQDDLTWWRVRTELDTGVAVEGWLAQSIGQTALLQA